MKIVFAFTLAMFVLTVNAQEKYGHPFKRMLFTTDHISDDSSLIEGYRLKADHFLLNNEKDSCLHYANKVAQIYFKNALHLKAIQIANSYLEKIAIAKDSLSNIYLDLIILQAISYELIYDFHSSLKFMEEAVNISNKINGLPNDFMAMLNSHMGYTYAFFKNPAAVKHFNIADSLIADYNNWEYKAMLYSDIAYYYSYSQSDVALFYANLSLDCYNKASYKNKSFEIMLRSMLGISAYQYDNKLAFECATKNVEQLKDKTSSIEYCEELMISSQFALFTGDFKYAKEASWKAGNLWKHKVGEISDRYSFCLLIYGMSLYYLKEDSCLHYLKKAVDIGIQHYSPLNERLFSWYYIYGVYLGRFGKHEEYLENIHKSICSCFNYIKDASDPFFTPSFDSTYINPQEVMLFLGTKGTAFLDVYKENKQEQYLEAAFQTYKTSDSLYWAYSKNDQMQIVDNILKFEQKKFWFDLAFSRAFNHAPENKYTELIYQILNRNKAQYLINEIDILQIVKENKSSTILSDVLVAQTKIRDIHQAISILEAEKLADSAFNLKLQLADKYMETYKLRDEFKKSFASNAAGKDNYSIDLNAVCKTLSDDEAVIDYYNNDSLLFIFTLTHEGFAAEKVKIDSSYFSNLKNVYRNIKKGETNQTQYTKLVGNLLLEPIKRHIVGKNKLIIIPYKEQCQIPFDLLQPNFMNGKNLISYYSTAIHYSLRLWLKSRNKSSDTLSKSLVAFAPGFQGEQENHISQKFALRNDSTFRSESFLGEKKLNLKPLPQSINEIETIAKMFKTRKLKSKSLIEKDATEANFKENILDYNIVHLSTHGYSSKTNPDLSGLFFYNKAKTTDDSYLNASEIYNLNINANLVVLSACKTGAGKIVEGENILAIPRGFLYAGVPNILVSLWKVHDEKTKDLMVAFYKHLLEDKVSYAEALRLAKLDCIEKGFLPVDWAGFVLIGN